MQINRVKHEGMTTTRNSFYFDNPIGNFVGIIFGAIVLLVGIVLCIFTILAYHQSFKIRDYKEVEATILQKDIQDDFTNYVLSYTIDNVTYTYNKAFAIDGEIGDKITAYYNPNDYTDIYWSSKDVSIFLPCISLIILITGISALRRNIKNLLHFINPSKYEAVLGGESVSISFGNGAEPIDNDKDNLSDGARTTFKF